MESPLFYTHTILNGKTVLRTLVNSGCQAYATIKESTTRRLRLETLDIEPRQASGWTTESQQEIVKVAYFKTDIGGIGERNAWAYVVPQQQEDLILGRPWIKLEGANIDERKDWISFDWTTEKIYNETGPT